MVWIMIHALNKNASTRINDYCQRNPEKLIAKLHYKILLMKNDGEVLAYLVKLKKVYGEWIELFAIQPLELFSLPEKVLKVVNIWLNIS